MNAFQALAQIQAATLAARTRTGDATIGTQVKAGKVQIVRVTYNAKGKSTVTPASDFLPIPEAVAALNAL